MLNTKPKIKESGAMLYIIIVLIILKFGRQT